MVLPVLEMAGALLSTSIKSCLPAFLTTVCGVPTSLLSGGVLGAGVVGAEAALGPHGAGPCAEAAAAAAACASSTCCFASLSSLI